MLEYVINFTGTIGTIPELNPINYCSFSLNIENARKMIPLHLHSIDISGGVLFKITSKIFDSNKYTNSKTVFRVLHNLKIQSEVAGWLESIKAENIYFVSIIQIKDAKLLVTHDVEATSSFSICEMRGDIM